MILLVIDTQKLLMNEKLCGFERFVHHIQALIATARENSVEVVYVRHDDGPGAALTKGTAGYEIYEGFQPVAGEKIFDKTVNSAFKESGLLEYLQQKGETNLIVSGLQTDYCIDATIKCGFEHGFQIFVPHGANTTVDNEFLSGEKCCRYYNEMIWNGRYAVCLPMEEVLKKLAAQKIG